MPKYGNSLKGIPFKGKNCWGKNISKTIISANFTEELVYSMSRRSCSFDLESKEANAVVLNTVVVKISTEPL